VSHSKVSRLKRCNALSRDKRGGTVYTFTKYKMMKSSALWLQTMKFPTLRKILWISETANLCCATPQKQKPICMLTCQVSFRYNPHKWASWIKKISDRRVKEIKIWLQVWITCSQKRWQAYNCNLANGNRTLHKRWIILQRN